MKKIILYAVLAVVVIIGCIAFFMSSNALEKETSALASDDANAIAYAWNPEELKTRAEPGLIKAMSSQGQSVEQLFEIYSKLGKPKAPLNCAFKDNMTAAHFITVTYNCDGAYENGTGNMVLTLRKKEEGDWNIYYIRVSSPQFEELQK